METNRVEIDGEALREARRVRGLSREKLANLCGVSSSLLYWAERNVCSARTANIIVETLKKHPVVSDG